MKNLLRLGLGLILSTALAGFAFAQDTDPAPQPTPSEIPTEVEEPMEKPEIPTEEQDKMEYEVPLLGVQTFKKKTELDMELEGLKAKAYINRGDEGSTEIRVAFDDMKDIPKDKKFVFWLMSPEKRYAKIGHVSNTGEDVAKPEIYGKTPLKDFGILVTVEDGDADKPTGKVYSTFKAGGR